MAKEYYKDYNNCVIACEYDDNLEECIAAIRSEHNDPTLCSKTVNDCTIINSENFKNLILFFIKLLQFLYCVRSHYANKYDELIISSVGKINLKHFHLSLDDLACVEYPGDKTFRNEYPHYFSDYLRIMTRISSVSKSIKDDEILSKFAEFCSDYQPWSRTLSTFVNSHAERLFGISIPRIENISSYGDFIKDCHINLLTFEKFLKKQTTFHMNLISFIESPMGLKGNKKRLRKRKNAYTQPKKKKLYSKKKSKANTKTFSKKKKSYSKKKSKTKTKALSKKKKLYSKKKSKTNTHSKKKK